MSVVTVPHYDAGERSMTLNRVQDVEPILDWNKSVRGERQTGDFRHIACIPNVILEKWLNEELARGNTTLNIFGPEMDAIIARKLRDPDWAYLRTDR